MKIKKLTFKNEFDGLGNALNLIPESHKVDNNVFIMTDGNEKYKVRWEGSLKEGRAIVVTASDKKMVNEDINKMKHLMGYKSSETLGLTKTTRIDENEKFNDLLNKTKQILGK